MRKRSSTRSFSPWVSRHPKTFRIWPRRMGLQLNRQGFCQTEEFNPPQTSVKGVFVGGAFRGPRDIPETVVEGSSAAAAAASFLVPNRLPQPAKEYPVEGALGDEVPKVGVFLCHCGDELKKNLSISGADRKDQNAERGRPCRGGGVGLPA